MSFRGFPYGMSPSVFEEPSYFHPHKTIEVNAGHFRLFVKHRDVGKLFPQIPHTHGMIKLWEIAHRLSRSKRVPLDEVLSVLTQLFQIVQHTSGGATDMFRAEVYRYLEEILDMELQDPCLRHHGGLLSSRHAFVTLARFAVLTHSTPLATALLTFFSFRGENIRDEERSHYLGTWGLSILDISPLDPRNLMSTCFGHLAPRVEDIARFSHGASCRDRRFPRLLKILYQMLLYGVSRMPIDGWDMQLHRIHPRHHHHLRSKSWHASSSDQALRPIAYELSNHHRKINETSVDVYRLQDAVMNLEDQVIRHEHMLEHPGLVI